MTTGASIRLSTSSSSPFLRSLHISILGLREKRVHKATPASYSKPGNGYDPAKQLHKQERRSLTYHPSIKSDGKGKKDTKEVPKEKTSYRSYLDQTSTGHSDNVYHTIPYHSIASGTIRYHTLVSQSDRREYQENLQMLSSSGSLIVVDIYRV